MFYNKLKNFSKGLIYIKHTSYMYDCLSRVATFTFIRLSVSLFDGAHFPNCLKDFHAVFTVRLIQPRATFGPILSPITVGVHVISMRAEPPAQLVLNVVHLSVLGFVNILKDFVHSFFIRGKLVQTLCRVMLIYCTTAKGHGCSIMSANAISINATSNEICHSK